MNKELQWQWCWECNSPTVNSYNGKENTCCAAWHDDSQFFLDFYKWITDNPAPNAPTEKQILDYVHSKQNYTPTEEELLICQIFDYERYCKKEFANVERWAWKKSVIIPSFEEVFSVYGFQKKTETKLTDKEVDRLLHEYDYDCAVCSFERFDHPAAVKLHEAGASILPRLLYWLRHFRDSGDEHIEGVPVWMLISLIGSAAEIPPPPMEEVAAGWVGRVLNEEIDWILEHAKNND